MTQIPAPATALLLLIGLMAAGTYRAARLQGEDLGFSVTRAEHAQAGLEQLRQLRQARFDLVLLDQQLPDGLGSELIGPLLAIDPQLPIRPQRHNVENTTPMPSTTLGMVNTRLRAVTALGV